MIFAIEKLFFFNENGLLLNTKLRVREGITMKKDDFIWHIGFSGNRAVVNRKMQLRYKNSNHMDLFKDGYFRAAFCYALWEQESKGNGICLTEFCAEMQKVIASPITVEDAKRLMGVYQFYPETVNCQYF